MDGMPWLCSMSSAQWASPLRTLPPPVSKRRFSAVGLVTKKLVGAMASRNKVAAKRIRSASTPSRPRSSIRASSSEPRARYACIVVRNRGLSRQAGSAKRLSPFCGATSDWPSPICRNCRPTLGQLCSNACGCRTAARPRSRSAPATWPRPEPASRPDPRTASAPSAPPASCAAVSARFSRGSAACARRGRSSAACASAAVGGRGCSSAACSSAAFGGRACVRRGCPAAACASAAWVRRAWVRRGCSCAACSCAAFGRRPLAAGLTCWRPLGPVSVSGASPRGVVMIVSPRSSPCLSSYVAEAAAGGSSLTTTSRLPSVWRARKSFLSYFPRWCAAPRRRTPIAPAATASPPGRTGWPLQLGSGGPQDVHAGNWPGHGVDGLRNMSCAPDRVKEPTNGPVIRDLRLYALAVRLREVPGTRCGKTS